MFSKSGSWLVLWYDQLLQRDYWLTFTVCSLIHSPRNSSLCFTHKHLVAVPEIFGQKSQVVLINLRLSVMCSTNTYETFIRKKFEHVLFTISKLSTLFCSNINIMKLIDETETQKWYWNFSRPSNFELIMRIIFCMFWWITQELLYLLKFLSHEFLK